MCIILYLYIFYFFLGGGSFKSHPFYVFLGAIYKIWQNFVFDPHFLGGGGPNIQNFRTFGSTLIFNNFFFKYPFYFHFFRGGLKSPKIRWKETGLSWSIFYRLPENIKKKYKKLDLKEWTHVLPMHTRFERAQKKMNAFSVQKIFHT